VSWNCIACRTCAKGMTSICPSVCNICITLIQIYSNKRWKLTHNSIDRTGSWLLAYRSQPGSYCPLIPSSGAVLAPAVWVARGLRRGAGHRKDFAAYMYKYAVFDIHPICQIALTENLIWGRVGADLWLAGGVTPWPSLEPPLPKFNKGRQLGHF